jgi:hypothetical protein
VRKVVPSSTLSASMVEAGQIPRAARGLGGAKPRRYRGVDHPEPDVFIAGLLGAIGADSLTSWRLSARGLRTRGKVGRGRGPAEQMVEGPAEGGSTQVVRTTGAAG